MDENILDKKNMKPLWINKDTHKKCYDVRQEKKLRNYNSLVVYFLGLEEANKRLMVVLKIKREMK